MFYIHKSTTHNGRCYTERQSLFNLYLCTLPGVVDADGLIRMFHKFGLILEPKEVYQYINEIGTPEKGVFDFPQFKTYCYNIDAFLKLKATFSTMPLQEEVLQEDEEEDWVYEGEITSDTLSPIPC